MKVSGGAWGELVRRIYKAVVVLTMLYVADMWLTLDIIVNGLKVEG